MCIPYTYRVTHVKTNKHYYGVQYGKKSNPERLWSTYFTSSKEIKRLILQDGKESFHAEIRKIFANPDDAREWEQKVLTKIINWPNYLNGHTTIAFSKEKCILGGVLSKIGERRFVQLPENEVIEKYLSGKSLHAVGKEYGVSKTKIACLLRSNNIEIRNTSQSIEFRKVSDETKEKMRNSKIGEKNNMHGKSLYDVWLNKYGKDEADNRMLNYSKKMKETFKCKKEK